MNKTWRRMESQPVLQMLARDLIFFTTIHDGDHVGIAFRLVDGAEDTDVVDSKRYRLRVYVEQEEVRPRPGRGGAMIEELKQALGDFRLLCFRSGTVFGREYPGPIFYIEPERIAAAEDTVVALFEARDGEREKNREELVEALRCCVACSETGVNEPVREQANAALANYAEVK